MKNIIDDTPYAITVTMIDDTIVKTQAIIYDWYYEYLRIFTPTSVDFFDRDNIESLVVNGDTIQLPT